MVWIDLDNSPHVPLFRPILAELGRRGVDVELTSRKHAQTEDLLAYWGIAHRTIGVHGGKNKVRKVLNLLGRSGQLAAAMRGRSISLAMSHGSRSHLVSAWRMGIPYLWMQDYEFQEKALANLFATHILLPEAIPAARVAASGYRLGKVLRYPGFKEEIYLKDFVPVPGFRRELGVDEESLLVTLRPPSMTANYHDARSEGLYLRCLEHFTQDPRVCCLIVNRTQVEREVVSSAGLEGRNIRFLSKPVDGLQLLWSSDVVISGGGTMNREAALLGVPTFSIFTGRRPFMDEHLQEMGRLTFLGSVEEIDRIQIGKRVVGNRYTPSNSGLASKIVDMIQELSVPPRR